MISYIGGKRNHANKILNKIIFKPGAKFYDLCCGSGEISLALLRRGFDPKRIVMVDSGPWGLVWKNIGNGRFNLSRFATICDHFNRNPCLKEWCQHVASEPLDADQIYKFLILQACSFGGRPIIVSNNKLKTCGFRKSIQPELNELFRRVAECCKLARGINGRHKDARCISRSTLARATVFCDPPYKKSIYGNDLLPSEVKRICKDFYCTYSVELSERCYKLQTKGRRGGVVGTTQIEYLSHITL